LLFSACAFSVFLVDPFDLDIYPFYRGVGVLVLLVSVPSFKLVELASPFL
jgi:hypothetical protein